MCKKQTLSHCINDAQSNLIIVIQCLGNSMHIVSGSHERLPHSRQYLRRHSIDLLRTLEQHLEILVIN